MMEHIDVVRQELNDAPVEVVAPAELETRPERNLRNRLIVAEGFMKQFYDFRYNEITATIEYRDKRVKEGFKPWDQRAWAKLFHEFGKNNIDIPENRLDGMIMSPDVSVNYDPFKEYFNLLPEWDGVDYIGDFMSKVYLVDEGQRAEMVQTFTKWFVAMVASLYDDRAVNQTCFVLQGPQAAFKTTFLNSLVPSVYAMDYLYSAKFNFESKDHIKYLGTKWLINLDELATFGRTDVGMLKSVLTQDRVVLRLPYGKADVHMWRRASFCGSINEESFLTDETGNRRFLIFAIKGIDFLNNKVRVDDLYRQGFYLFRTGFKFWFDRDETLALEERNRDFHNVSIEEDLVVSYLDVPTEEDMKGGDIQYANTAMINLHLAGKSNRVNVNESTKKRLGQVLKKLGFTQKSKRVPGYKNATKVWVVKYKELETFNDEEDVLRKMRAEYM